MAAGLHCLLLLLQLRLLLELLMRVAASLAPNTAISCAWRQVVQHMLTSCFVLCCLQGHQAREHAAVW
jgi:hypothetical protein